MYDILIFNTVAQAHCSKDGLTQAWFQSDHYLLACYKYIELNPVRAGLVQGPADYVWSSYRGECVWSVSSNSFYTDLKYWAQQGGSDCQVVGGKRIDQAVVEVFLEAMSPCAAMPHGWLTKRRAVEGEALRTYWAHQIERVAYQAQRTERGIPFTQTAITSLRGKNHIPNVPGPSSPIPARGHSMPNRQRTNWGWRCVRYIGGFATVYWPANSSPRVRPGGSCSPMRSRDRLAGTQAPRVGWE